MTFDNVRLGVLRVCSGIRSCALVMVVALSLSGCTQLVMQAIEESKHGDKAKEQHIIVSVTRDYSDRVTEYSTLALLITLTDGSRQVTGTGNQATAPQSPFAAFFTTGGLVGGSGSASRAGVSKDIVSGRMVAMLLELGYSVLESDDVIRLASTEDYKFPTEKVLSKLSREAGANALWIGVFEGAASTKKDFLTFGLSSETKVGIISGKFKLIDLETGRIMVNVLMEFAAPKDHRDFLQIVRPIMTEAMSGEAKSYVIDSEVEKEKAEKES